MNDYTKSTDQLPKEATPVWVRICGCRPRKMYRTDTETTKRNHRDYGN